MPTFPRSSVQLGGELGSGNFGNVYTGHFAPERGAPGSTAPTPCAVKQPNADGIPEFKAELQIMTKLVQLGSHPHIIAVLGHVQGGAGGKNSMPMLLLELCTQGNLKSLLKLQRDCPPAAHELVGFGCDVADAMAFLQTNQLLHRDVAARNVLVTEDRRCKLGDFGLSKDVGVKGPPPVLRRPLPSAALPVHGEQHGTARHSVAR